MESRKEVKRLLQEKRNECLGLVRESNRKINVVRGSSSESKAHRDAKFNLCSKLINKGKHFVTEAIFKNGSRADILILDDFTVVEILCSETIKEARKKVESYPEGLDIMLVKV